MRSCLRGAVAPLRPLFCRRTERQRVFLTKNGRRDQDQSPAEADSSSQPVSSTSGRDVDTESLEPLWAKLKTTIKKDLPPDQAELVDSFTVDDILDSNSLLKQLAEKNLGPILAAMGVDEDPLSFFIDLLKYSLMVQLLTSAVVFYGVELGLHMDAGEALRAVSGLLLGYFLRIFLKVEQLSWPLYDFVLSQVAQNSVYNIAQVSKEELQSTLNGLAVTVASALFISQVGFGLNTEQSLMVVVPLVAGLFLCDATYILAFFIKSRINQQ